jgi:hypothetical protein
MYSLVYSIPERIHFAESVFIIFELLIFAEIVHSIPECLYIYVAESAYSFTERLHLLAKIVYSITERLHLFTKIEYSFPWRLHFLHKLWTVSLNNYIF